MMKRVLLIIFLLLVLVLPVTASSESNFNEWKNTYYEHKSYNDKYITEEFNKLSTNGEYLSLDDFLKWNSIYKLVFSDDSSSQLNSRMHSDFKSADLNGDGKLTVDEFKDAFLPLYCFRNLKEHYDTFKKLDRNGDGKLDLDEFSEIGYIFASDSFWDGYNIEEICVVEFESVDNGDHYLNFTEYTHSMGF